MHLPFSLLARVEGYDAGAACLRDILLEDPYTPVTVGDWNHYECAIP
jgi:hypothetical protein